MRVIVTGGGTGGHIYPALAIADKIMEKEPDSEILYMGGEKGLEKEVVADSRYPFASVPAKSSSPAPGKIRRTAENLGAGIVTAGGILKALRQINRFKPDCVIGTGGYASAPCMFAAVLKGLPTYIHEQNAYPGVVNRNLAGSVNRIFLGFKDAEKVLNRKDKTVFTGNPVRSVFSNTDKNLARGFLKIPEDDFVVFAFGGSQGAGKINETGYELFKKINGKKGYTLLFGTGKVHYEEIVKRIRDEKIDICENVRILPYINEMPQYIGASDLVIARAGAISTAEICVAGKPSILIPSPIAKDDHQYYNAKAIADAGGAMVIRDSEADPVELAEKIMKGDFAEDDLKEMGEAAKKCTPADAAEKIYLEIKKDACI